MSPAPHDASFGRLLACAVTLALAVALPVSPTTAQGSSQAQGGGFSNEQLDQMTAPFALYPDDVVSQILMASTYPLEIVEANRWAKANAGMQGDALAQALNQQTWDASVKSLVQFPDLLNNLSSNLSWTQSLGDAVLWNQQAVLTSVQRLRQRAQAAGNLQSNQQQTIVVQAPPAQTTVVVQGAPAPQPIIRITSAVKAVVALPVYTASVVFGPWPYPSYPPYSYPPPPAYRPVANAAVGFAAGVAVGAAWGYAWGGCNWGRGDIDIDVNRNVNFNGNINRIEARKAVGVNGRWNHNSIHRKGVRYHHKGVANRYGRGRVNKVGRAGYRGHVGKVGRPGGVNRVGRPGGINNVGRPGGVNKVGRPGGVNNVGRPGGVNRAGRPGGVNNVGRPGGVNRGNVGRRPANVGRRPSANRKSYGHSRGAFGSHQSRSRSKSASYRGRSSRGHSRSRGGGGRSRGGRGGRR